MVMEFLQIPNFHACSVLNDVSGAIDLWKRSAITVTVGSSRI